MTLTAREAVYSIFGAYRLALLDKTGLSYLDRTPEGALRSFYAALIVLPAYAVLVALRLWDVLPQVSLLRFITVEGLAYVISWSAFPLAMFHISGLLDRSSRYFDFLSAYNWSSVIQMGVYLPVVAVSDSGLVPGSLGEGMVLIVTLLVLIYQWFIARTTLDISGGAAAGVVLLDMVLAVFITGTADGMLA
ncbi:hypothetical protein IGS68_22055 [Skermanella sp. TT6]|uniref:Yip1 domain-containing protein n=1 Tax=Skermanella cutis TaxID=2775420 RepID=A0ABX7B2W7_9PROT|nr:hypothetical protein [Skermanella sp. TT6]QQP88676.1 hypothetical protein IGS68_22055 [Skermanella sp. TT6]